MWDCEIGLGYIISWHNCKKVKFSPMPLLQIPEEYFGENSILFAGLH